MSPDAVIAIPDVDAKIISFVELIVLLSILISSTCNTVSVPIWSKSSAFVTFTSVSSVSLSTPPILYALVVSLISTLTLAVHAFAVVCHVHNFCPTSLVSNTRPALLASAPVSVVPSAVLAISIFLSSTRNVATSILVVSPSITILPVTLRSP